MTPTIAAMLLQLCCGVVNLSTDKPIFVLDSEKSSSSINKKNFATFEHSSEEVAPLRFEPTVLSD